MSKPETMWQYHMKELYDGTSDQVKIQCAVLSTTSGWRRSPPVLAAMMASHSVRPVPKQEKSKNKTGEQILEKKTGPENK